MSRIAILVACLLLGSGIAAAQGIIINNNDGAMEGFNDPTAVTSDIDGQATTLGQDRLDCLTAAAQVWANFLDLSVTVEIDATFDSLGGNQFGAPLGAAGFKTVHADFTGAPVSSMWFSAPQANQLFGSDINGGATSEMNAFFNSDVDGGTVLGSTTWYYGTDGVVPPDHIDFFSTALHELGHAFGFATVMDVETANDANFGDFLNGIIDIYADQLRQEGAVNKNFSAMNDAERETAIESLEVVWKGATVVGEQGGNEPIYAPSTIQPGSSISHWDTSASPNLLMEPFATDPFTSLTLEVQAFQDLLWPLAADPLDPDNVYVDFSFGGAESGAAANPFNTLAEAIAAANPNATINIDSGTSSETFTGGSVINQDLTLLNNTPGSGAVIIGSGGARSAGSGAESATGFVTRND